MRTIEELLSEDSSWVVMQDLMKNATNQFEILPKNEEQAKETLYLLQQSLQSLMGAIVYETGGILIDNGWLRLLGSGSERLSRTLYNWNLGRSHETAEETPEFMMVADDALGGIFAINGTGLGEDTGMIYYLAPDTVEWEALEVNYHEFLQFCFMGQVQDFYSKFRWEGWQEDVARMSADNAYIFMPPLWEDDDSSLDKRERGELPMDDTFELLVEMNNMLLEEYGDEDEDGCGCGCGCDEEDDDSDCGCGGCGGSCSGDEHNHQ